MVFDVVRAVFTILDGNGSQCGPLSNNCSSSAHAHAMPVASYTHDATFYTTLATPSNAGPLHHAESSSSTYKAPSGRFYRGIRASKGAFPYSHEVYGIHGHAYVPVAAECATGYYGPGCPSMVGVLAPEPFTQSISGVYHSV